MPNKKKEVTKKEEKNAMHHEANDAANQKTIDNHKQAAAHHIEAAKHNMEAAHQYGKGNHEKAAQSSILARGHHAIAGEFLNDDAKHHAQALKETNYR